MSTIEIYSKVPCPYCERAKLLLKRKGLEFVEYRIDQDPDRFSDLMTRAPGQRSMPQIFIHDQHIGGCDDLYALDSAGKLESLLAKDSVLNKPDDED